ncbi:hypothetical protein ACFLZ8_05930, partial [Planctomycetota bacterium]
DVWAAFNYRTAGNLTGDFLVMINYFGLLSEQLLQEIWPTSAVDLNNDETILEKIIMPHLSGYI